MMTTDQGFDSLIEELGRAFAKRAADHDERDEFVAENYRTLREQKIFSAAVPKELGGRGISHRQMSRALRTLGRHCSSTALAFSMHQHLVAAQVWNHLHGKPGKVLLERVAAEELILISTGAGDWLASNGRMERVDGGYRVTAKKNFASGCPLGNLLITSSVYEDPKEGSQVLHFGLPISSEGVRIANDWRAHGMRGTGSHTVELENVFVPEKSISLMRPRARFHPAWNTILTVAMPYLMSVYCGVAEAAAELARERAKKKRDSETPYLLGEMENHLTTAQLAVDSMVGIANDWDFEAVVENANAILIRKTIASRAIVASVEKALEAAGGAAYFRAVGIERLLRDVHGAQFHPLPEKRQQLFTGRLALGLDPITD